MLKVSFYTYFYSYCEREYMYHLLSESFLEIDSELKECLINEGGKAVTANPIPAYITPLLYKEIVDDNYKHSEEIVRTLLSNPASIKIVYDFYKMQNDDAKLETRLAKSANEILYGYSSEDSLVVEKLDDMMKSIPDFESKGISIGSISFSFKILEISDIIQLFTDL